MMKVLSIGMALSAMLGAALMTPATAQVRFDSGVITQTAQPMVLAQYPGRGYGGRGYGGRGYRGDGVAAGIAGLAAGAIVGGAIASQAQPVYPEDENVNYCISRFRSYDPASGTYLGNDGYRHPCP